MSLRREKQLDFIRMSYSELLEKWREAHWEMFGEAGSQGAPKVKRDDIASSKITERNRLAAKYNIPYEVELDAALCAAIDEYYCYWIENANPAHIGFCTRLQAIKFSTTLQSLVAQMKDAQLMARLQVGADITWPGETTHTRQLSFPFPLDDYDAFAKSPAAFRWAAEWFQDVAKNAEFDANKMKRIDSGDAKAAAQVLYKYYVTCIDAGAKFFKSANYYFEDGCDDDEVSDDNPKSAFDFVFLFIRLIDNTITVNQLKDFGPSFDTLFPSERSPVYDPMLWRAKQMTRKSTFPKIG